MQVTGQSYGTSLPDQVERIAASFDTHLELICDIRDLYRDRAALEREYASKLLVLAKKGAEKKGKVESLIAFGGDPAKAWDSDMARKNSLNAAYTELVDSIVTSAQDHVNLAEDFTSHVVDVLRAVERKSEESKKKEMQFFQKLLADRDRVYAERLKSKQKYDEDCMEIESQRHKQGRAQDDKHADRAAKQAEHQRNDMLNSKNLYIISTAMANSTKTQFYDINLPGLEDQFQILQRRLVQRVVKILQHSNAVHLKHLDTMKGRIIRVDAALVRVDVEKDQDLFIQHNIRPFKAPNDWAFEPCTFHYDNSDMNTEPMPKIFLQNKLSRCRSKLQELESLVTAKRKEVDQLSSQLSSYTADHTLGSIDEISDSYLETQHQLMFYTTSELILNAELKTVVAAIGDDEGARRPHLFKGSTFSIPTQCTYCKTSIWGLSKQGKSCKSCGISVHSKCELKVPAECGNVDGISRQSSRNGAPTSPRVSSRVVSPSRNVPTASSFVRSVASEESLEVSYPSAQMLFDFSPNSAFELGVSEGETVRVIEPDDGSGWVKVMDPHGKDGLVPASYLQLELPATPAMPSPRQSLTARKSSGPRRYVCAIYSYEAQGPDELSLKEGERVELTDGPTGGQSYGDGWWEGLDTKGRKGIFPSNYVEMA